MLRSLSIVALMLCSAVALAADAPGNLQLPAKVNAAAKIEAELDQQTEVQYLDTQLADVINDLELRHRIQIEGDWEAITAAVGQPGPELPITCSLKDVSLVAALEHILTPQKLTWTIDNEVLLFTSRDKESEYVSTKVYKVGDFAPDLEILQTAIESTIEVLSWPSNGGNIGAMARYDDTKSLIVTHTARTHRRIAQLIKDLRATKADEEK